MESASGKPHAKITASQSKRRKSEGFSTDIRYEFNQSFRELVEAGVSVKSSKKVMKKAYIYFNGINAFD